MNKRIVAVSCFSIMLAIALGAFGAHGLRKMTTDENLLRGFQTGVDYHLFHSIAFLLFGLWGASVFSQSLRKTASIFLAIGVFVFSGSLYALTVFELMGWSHAWIGPITPIGGTFLILGWGWMGYSFFKAERPN
jgi:uncharacterized membrane protein YgdD (TMEM256/DUF423 family)